MGTALEGVLQAAIGKKAPMKPGAVSSLAIQIDPWSCAYTSLVTA